MVNKIVESRYGTMIYPDKDIYIGRSLELYGEYSYHEIEFLKSLVGAGDVAIDVGANIGAITVPLAQKIGPSGYVVAFEPQQYIYYMLCGNIVANNLTNTNVFQRIVSDVNDQIKTIPVFDFEKEGNFGALSVQETDETTLACPVKTVTIDSLQLAFAKLIKIDVEGAELSVLRGAINLIERCNPYLYVECLDKNEANKLIDFLQNVDYAFKFHQTPLFNPDNFLGNKVDVLGQGILEDKHGRKPTVVSGNFFCYPEDEKDKWESLTETNFFFSDLDQTILN